MLLENGEEYESTNPKRSQSLNGQDSIVFGLIVLKDVFEI